MTQKRMILGYCALIFSLIALAGCAPAPPAPEAYTAVFGDPNPSERGYLDWPGTPKEEVMRHVDLPFTDSTRVLYQHKDHSYVEEWYYVQYPASFPYKNYGVLYRFVADTLVGGGAQVDSWFDGEPSVMQRKLKRLKCNEPDAEWTACEVGYSSDLSLNH